MENPLWMNKLLEIVEEKKSPETEIKKQSRIILDIKEDGLLWTEMLKTLYKIKRKRKEIIPFPVVFWGICSKFSITKAKGWNCLFFLKEFGLIEISRSHGIKLNYRIK